MPESQTKVSPPAEFRELLLATTRKAVPNSYLIALRSFCDGSPEIEEGYVCAAATLPQDPASELSLRFSVKLKWPVTRPEDMRGMNIALARRFGSSYPALRRELGFTVLADRAIPAWEKFGRRIFPA